ncbi:MAG: hypothetical protein FWE60_00190 [Oscillospiraceae bacterium]|nr:hypothetical protein [Oscillospiraceae bacterium]
MRSKYISLLLVFAFLCGCTSIRYDTDDGENRRSSITERLQYNDSQSLFFPITRQAFSLKMQMEDITSYEHYDELTGFEGRGYIWLREGWNADFELEVPTPQHYSIFITAASVESGDSAGTADAIIALSAGGVRQGAFYADNAKEFRTYSLHGVYLEAGVNRLSLEMLKGSAFIDYVAVNDFELPESRFNSSRLPANPDASNSVRLLMDYFGEIFGQYVLLAQHVTPGTNTEIGAIFGVTGRYPAVRAADLMAYSRSYMGEMPVSDDIDLALEWAEAGGLVSYGWTWYAPPVDGEQSHYYADAAAINLNDAFTLTRIADLDESALVSLRENGVISLTCLELIREIDHMAENLKRLRDEDVPVLWRPLHQAGTRWFWWGACEPEAYVWLWRLMFERFSGYHDLDNLIWVWSGGSGIYYPGDDYVDIIGEDIYTNADISGLPAFSRASGYSSKRRLTALTECGLLPSPDLLNRDRTLWLWTALYRGDYVVDSNGRVWSPFNTPERLKRAYNHELTITLDKLPENY